MVKYIPGAYELIEIAEIMKEETNVNVIIELDKNTMKSLKESKQGAFNFDSENSIAPLLGFRKNVHKKVNKHLSKLLILWVLVLLTFIVMWYLVLRKMGIYNLYKYYILLH